MITAFADDALRSVVYSDDPVLLMIGDDEGDLALGRAAAARVGCHVAGAVSIAEALARLDQQAAADAALLFAHEPSEALDQVLDRLTGEARRGRMAAIVVAPDAMIDPVTRPAFHPRVEHLFDPDPARLESALAEATAPAPPQLHDVGRGAGATILQQLSEEAARIAAALASMSASPVPAARTTEANGAADPGIGSAQVRSIIRARRMRDQYFRGELFADPAFDMLLDLYAARLEGNRVAVSSLCIAAAVPATTALRWIKALTDRGLFVRAADPQDGRRVYIELSNEAAHAMGLYLTAVQRAGITAL